MSVTISLKKSDLQAKQDLYNNFSNIAFIEKREAINLIIQKKRNITLKEAKCKKLLRHDEVTLFLSEFGIEFD